MKKFFFYTYSPFQKIIIGLSFHIVGNVLRGIYGTDVPLIFFGGIGWGWIAYGILTVKKIYKPFWGLHSSFFYYYFLVVLIMILRGYNIDYSYQWISTAGMINYHFLSPYYILPYFLPLILFIGIRQFEFNSLSKINLIFNIFFIIMFFTTIKGTYIDSQFFASKGGGYDDFKSMYASVSYVGSLFVTTSFFLFCKKYINSKLWFFNIICCFLALFNVALAGRRGAVCILTLYIIVALLLNFKEDRLKERVKSLVLVFSALAFLGIYYMSMDSTFLFLKKRGLENTRVDVHKSLIAQMDIFDWCFGRGLNGRYYHNLHLENNYLGGWRYGCETGFLNLVLKGGLVLTALHIFTLLVPALKGVLNSKNAFTKALGAYVILSIIELYPFGWPKFDLKYLIVWIGAALCSFPHIRKMNDVEIKNRFFS
ncbi:hypothetical protein [Desulfobacter curvatus]|uniref:hypothetical protein n=1 Tax=Desulfobacter curvatus TaxID=2290 RepID=UPI000368C18C|nr:hypothetical protein [Desulfobacter curvatus]